MHVVAEASSFIKGTFQSFDTTALWVVSGISVLALGVAYVLRSSVLREPQGTAKMQEIAKAIQDGSRAYLNRQFRTVAAFAVLLAIGLYFALPAHGGTHSDFVIKFGRSIAFIIGASFSAITGFTGMWLAVRSNVRVANAARESGYRKALTVAFRTGGVAGMFTVGLGLLGAIACPCWRASASARRSSRCSCGWAAASTRRPRTSALTSWARWSRGYPRTTRATPP